LKQILQLLEHTAVRFPQRPALGDENGTVCWAEVRRMTRQIGTALAREKVAGRPVALYLGRETRCVLAMLGVLQAGGFYTVLDTAQPVDRVQRILGRLHPALLLTDQVHAVQTSEFGVKTLLWEQVSACPADDALLDGILAHAVDTDLAYVLFTSGSTGEPKGVAVSHRNVLAYSEWVAQAFSIDENTVFGNQTPFYFSMSVTDIYTSLRTGACMQIVPKRLFSFPVQLLDYLTARSVNTLYWVPTALGIVANWKALEYTVPPALRTILFAGEVMPTAKLNYWRAHYPDALFANLYGPTETTDICAYYILDRTFADDEALPIGYPCENCGLLVLQADGTAAPEGQEGELCARGSFVAAGYYGMPEKTADRFVCNPLQKNYPEIIYRTGDLVRYNRRGELEYCGRIDNQIKHLGYRIELGEVEMAAYGQDKLESCACLYDAAQDRLVLFFQAKRDVTEALRTRLAEKLPAYMRPAEYFRVRNMPQNANGKIDRRELKKQLEAARSAKTQTAGEKSKAL
jgi:amino acid adenylation domain-containing protein